MSTTQKDSSPIEPFRDGHHSIGNAHFWDRVARSRRQFMNMVAGVTGLILGTSLQQPALAASKEEPLAASKEEPLARKFTVTTWTLNTTTDSTGYFSVPHGLVAPGGPGNVIRGITVVVQHLNGNWHTLDSSNTVTNRFWFNQTYVQGQINSSGFYNRPVWIVVFTEYVIA